MAVGRTDGDLIAWSGDIDRPFYLRSSLGIAAKTWDGSDAAVEVGAIAALHSKGFRTPTAAHHLQSRAQPPISGGGRIVGKAEPRLELLMS